MTCGLRRRQTCDEGGKGGKAEKDRGKKGVRGAENKGKDRREHKRGEQEKEDG